MKSTEIVPIIEVSDVCERLVGITPVHLQNFVQRGSYGIRSSVSPGKVRSHRRLFSLEDVYGIALVWLLFEGGLRGDPIARILNGIVGKKATANRAAQELIEGEGDYLFITRAPRQPSKSPPDKPDQRVQICTEEELGPLLEHFSGAVIVVVPFGPKFADVHERLEMLFGLTGDPFL